MALPLVSLHVQMSFTWPLETQAKQHLLEKDFRMCFNLFNLVMLTSCTP